MAARTGCSPASAHIAPRQAPGTSAHAAHGATQSSSRCWTPPPREETPRRPHRTETLTAALTAENRRFGEHRCELAGHLHTLRQGVLDCLFAAHLDLLALAWDISSNVCSEDVNSAFGGVLAEGPVTTHHPATVSASELFEAVQVACDYLWTEDCYERTLLARRSGLRTCVITEYDPREHNRRELLEILSESDAPPAPDATPARTSAGTRPASPAITLTEADVDDLADDARINVPTGPHGEELILDGEDFDEQTIDALRAGNGADVEGYTFGTESSA